MKYTSPNVLTTIRADHAIQTGDNQAAKRNPIQPDALHMPSTTSAYEADE